MTGGYLPRSRSGGSSGRDIADQIKRLPVERRKGVLYLEVPT
jgi:hypothetical protein